MRNFIIVTIILTANFCKGQSLNLVPVDSANFEIIADSLVDLYSEFQNSTTFNPETLEICPCVISDINGLISYRSSSVFKKYNKCLFLYKTNAEYFIRQGQMTDVKNESGKYIWRLSTYKMNNEIAEEYIIKTRIEIANAKVPEFQHLVIVNDGVSHIFGDLENNIYAITPRAYFSDSVIELITLSENLIKIK